MRTPRGQTMGDMNERSRPGFWEKPDSPEVIVVYHVFNAASVIVALLFTWWVWDRLPESIPVHFGIDGRADRYTDKGGEVFFILGCLPILFSAIFYGSMLLLRLLSSYPALLNIPDKEAFLSLPEERRKPVFRLLDVLMVANGVVLNGLGLFISYFTARTAMEGSGHLSICPVWLFIAALIAVNVYYTIRIVKFTRWLVRDSQIDPR